MKSNPSLHEAMNFNTSARIPLTAGICNFLAIALMYCTHLKWISTAVTWAAPREAISKVTLPVPAQRSSTSMPPKSMRCWSTLNIASFAMSVVGRTGKLVGGCSRRPAWLPPIIRIGIIPKVTKSGVGSASHHPVRECQSTHGYRLMPRSLHTFQHVHNPDRHVQYHRPGKY